MINSLGGAVALKTIFFSNFSDFDEFWPHGQTRSKNNESDLYFALEPLGGALALNIIKTGFLLSFFQISMKFGPKGE